MSENVHKLDFKALKLKFTKEKMMCWRKKEHRDNKHFKILNANQMK